MITTAILLAAGEGSRLRSEAPLKPLCNLAGQSLLAHAVSGLARAGMKRVVVVLGYGAGEVSAYIAERSWPLAVETVVTSDYRRPNGVSLLAAEPVLRDKQALLAMCDHLVEPALYRRVAEAECGAGACLGVDKRLQNDWVDLEDVTRVQTSNGRIVAIGKGIRHFDCFDTGVFAIGLDLFAALRSLESPSLTQGMQILASRGTALTVDCSGIGWIDVDDHAALEKAERWLNEAWSADGQHRPALLD